MLCCRGQLAQHALGFISFLFFHTEVLTANWLPVELLQPANVDANVSKCSCRAEKCVQPQCSLSAKVPRVGGAGSAAFIPKRSIDQRPKSS